MELKSSSLTRGSAGEEKEEVKSNNEEVWS